jgi:hypothetical protein
MAELELAAGHLPPRSRPPLAPLSLHHRQRHLLIDNSLRTPPPPTAGCHSSRLWSGLKNSVHLMDDLRAPGRVKSMKTTNEPTLINHGYHQLQASTSTVVTCHHEGCRSTHELWPSRYSMARVPDQDQSCIAFFLPAFKSQRRLGCA